MSEFNNVTVVKKANIYFDGLPPFSELDLLNREIAIGPARLSADVRRKEVPAMKFLLISAIVAIFCSAGYSGELPSLGRSAEPRSQTKRLLVEKALALNVGDSYHTVTNRLGIARLLLLSFASITEVQLLYICRK